MTYHVVLYSPDRGAVYDGHTPDQRGVGGGITARIALLAALARMGQRVEAVVNCAGRAEIDGVTYIPLDEAASIDCDVFIACSTGGDLSFAPLAAVKIAARLRLLWIMGSPQPKGIDSIQLDAYIVASNFLRDVAVERWRAEPEQVFVVHHGLKQAAFRAVEATPPPRDPFALVYTGHPSKGLDAAIAVLRRLRAHDSRYHLDVYGGNALWSPNDATHIDEPGVAYLGLTGQRDLIPHLFTYGYCIALQAMEEGFSIAVQEAKRAGVIVLANAGSSFPEAIADGIDGFLFYDPHDSPICHERAAELIISLNADPERQAHLRDAAARTPWDWDTAAQTWIAYADYRLGSSAPPVEIVNAAGLLRFPDGLHDPATGYFYPALAPALAEHPIELPPTPTRVLIAGYYGFGNTGDEAILSALLTALRSRDPHLTATVVSGSPADTARTYGVQAVLWDDLPALAAAANRADALILGGGGLFQDYWGVPTELIGMPNHRGMAYFMAFPLLAALLEKPLALYALGVGPLKTDEGRRMTLAAFEMAGRISVRDHDSRELMIGIGAPPDRIIQTADPAYLLRSPADERADDLLDALRLTDKTTTRLGVALRPWDIDADPDRWTREIAAALDLFIDRVGAEIVFIPFQMSDDPLSDDRAAAEAVRGQMRHGGRALIAQTPAHPNEMLTIIGACDLMLGMRLHSIILAAVVGVPSVGLVYDPKVGQTMADLSLHEFMHPIADLNAARLAESLTHAHEQRADLSARVSAYAEKLTEAARADVGALYAWLEQPSAPPIPESISALARAALLRYIRRAGELGTEEPESIRRALAMLHSKDRRLGALMVQLAEAQAHLYAASERENALQTELGALADAVSAHTAEIADLNHQIDDLEGDLSALYIQKDALHAHIEQVELHAEALEHDKTALHAQIEALRQTLATTERYLHDSNAYIEHMRRDTAAHPIMASFAFVRLLLRRPFSAAQAAARTAYHVTVPLSVRVAFRDFRRRHAEVGALVRNPPVFLARKLYQTIVPLPMRLALRDRRQPRMNWYAYAFDRFKRARTALYGAALESIRVPFEPGLVTVVLPAYNGEDMIGEAVETLLRQTYPNWDLIIINDGSQDRTGDIADDYARRDPRIRVVHQENRKIPRTLSRGFRMARGEFLTWTSCDNRMKPDFLAKMVASLRRHSCWDMIYANMDIIGDDGGYLRDSGWYAGYQSPPGSEHVYLPALPDELNVWANNYVGAAFMYRARTAWLIGDYSRHRFTTEDYDYWMRVNALGTLRHADFTEPVYDYRFHAKSLTSKDKELGITRSREKLMVFDDFRRDFYLMPIIWRIEGGGDCLYAPIHAANHLMADEQFGTEHYPPFWTPFVYAQFVTDADAAPPPPADLPPMAYRVLIALGSALPDQASEAWDCCIHLSEDNIPLPALGGYRGWFGVENGAALFSLIDVRAKEAQLAHIESEIAAANAPRLRASVVICTHRFNERLINAIRSVAAQTIPPDEYEVIVVNNNPSHTQLAQTIETLRASVFGGSADRLRYIVCPIPGLSAARNAGIAAAAGEIVCFIDDDAVARHDWLAHILQAYADHPQAGVIGGTIELVTPARRPAALLPGLEKYWSHFAPGNTHYAPATAWYEYPWGANWTARRRALLEIGGFRSGYGRKGSDFGGGEELAAAALTARLGWEIGVEPKAHVHHDVEPNRFTLKHLRRTLLSGHLSQYRLQRDLYIPMETTLRAVLFMLRHYNFDPALNRRSWVAWYDLLARKLAQIALLRTQLGDLRARFRRPAVAVDDCEGEG